MKLLNKYKSMLLWKYIKLPALATVLSAAYLITPNTNEAAVIVTVTETMSGVSMAWDGSLDISAAFPLELGVDTSFLPDLALNPTGFLAQNGGSLDFYLFPLIDGSIDSFANFPPIDTTILGSSFGIGVEIGQSGSSGSLFVDSGYTSGSQLSGSVFISGENFESLGMDFSSGSTVIDLGGSVGNTITIRGSVVPEPSTYALFGLGFAGFILLRCKKRL